VSKYDMNLLPSRRALGVIIIILVLNIYNI